MKEIKNFIFFVVDRLILKKLNLGWNLFWFLFALLWFFIKECDFRINENIVSQEIFTIACKTLIFCFENIFQYPRSIQSHRIKYYEEWKNSNFYKGFTSSTEFHAIKVNFSAQEYFWFFLQKNGQWTQYLKDIFCFNL